MTVTYEHVSFLAPLTERTTRVVLDPLPTLLTSVIELFGPLRHRVPAAQRRHAASVARGLDLRPLAMLLVDPLRQGVPDFVGLTGSGVWDADPSHQVPRRRHEAQ